MVMMTMKAAAVLAALGVAAAQEPVWVMPAADEATGQICHLQYLALQPKENRLTLI